MSLNLGKQGYLYHHAMQTEPVGARVVKRRLTGKQTANQYAGRALTVLMFDFFVGNWLAGPVRQAAHQPSRGWIGSAMWKCANLQPALFSLLLFWNQHLRQKPGRTLCSATPEFGWRVGHSPGTITRQRMDIQEAEDWQKEFGRRLLVENLKVQGTHPMLLQPCEDRSLGTGL